MAYTGGCGSAGKKRKTMQYALKMKQFITEKEDQLRTEIADVIEIQKGKEDALKSEMTSIRDVKMISNRPAFHPDLQHEVVNCESEMRTPDGFQDEVLSQNVELTTGIDGFENDMIQSKSSEQFQNGEQTTSASMMNDETDYDSHRYNYQL